MTRTEFTEVKRLVEFNRDIKKLLKRFRTLEEDLESFVNYQLKLTHILEFDNSGVVRISNLGIEKPKIFKSRKFACKALKGYGSKSGIRIIYSYCEETGIIKLIEIYYKGDKANEDYKRIKKYFGNRNDFGQ